MPEQRPMREIELCEASAVADGAALPVCVPGVGPLAVVRTLDSIFVIADECTHASAKLSDGFVDEDVIVCPIHAGEFHLPTGKAMGFPVTEDIVTYESFVRDGKVVAKIPAEA